VIPHRVKEGVARKVLQTLPLVLLLEDLVITSNFQQIIIIENS
jgi:hypothetical protein